MSRTSLQIVFKIGLDWTIRCFGKEHFVKRNALKVNPNHG